ncbi:aminoacyl-tRNA hydrolase [Lentisphaerota bacterium WC36G]|nr:aminoacyl-tRNA hydrolase [Lentisphaerae bacterium WC36]
MRNIQKIKVIVGLGNPGDEYKNTRHNAGFMIIDQFLSELKTNFIERHIFSSFLFTGKFRGQKIFLQKPLTFMNLSGKALSLLIKKEKLLPEEVLLVYDDTDLPLGKIRIKQKGSSGGHNGVESVIQEINSSNFARLRIGVNSEERTQQVDFVLGDFTSDEEKIFLEVKKGCCEAIKLILARGVSQAMNQYNGIDYSESNSEDNEK